MRQSHSEQEKIAQREASQLHESVKGFEEQFSSSGSDSDEGCRSQVGKDDSQEAPQSKDMMIVVRNTFIDVCEAEEGKGGQGLPRINSAPGKLQGDNKYPSPTPQPTTSEQPLEQVLKQDQGRGA